LCLGHNEIKTKYDVDLDLEEVEYCKKHNLITFITGTTIIMVRNALEKDKDKNRELWQIELLQEENKLGKEKEVRIKPNG
jgi:hypothetical protein